MPTLDIITVYNNVELLHEMQKSATENGGYSNVRFIALDNTNGRFQSAAQAYNYALDNLCTADVLVFCHQDIVFLENSVSHLRQICMDNQRVLYGAAGAISVGKYRGRQRTISSMCEGTSKQYHTLQGTQQAVMTLDECLIAAHRDVFETVRFDEKVCNGWHLYAVDLSLQCHLQQVGVMVYDANIIHLSSGKIDASFRQGEDKLAEKWREIYRILVYTCDWCYTNPLLFKLLRLSRKLRHLE